MPRIVRQGEALPDWCQLREFSIVELDKAGLQLTPKRRSERVVACRGSVQLRGQGRSKVVGMGQYADIGPEGPVEVVPVYDSAQVVLLSGDWGTETGGCGIFSAEDTTTPVDRGDPVSYPKTTNIDSHYHDCDEYWILLEGSATVVVDGDAGPFAPGNCLCIGMGHPHDMPHAPERVKAVFFETGLERRKRVGHLWEHTHGVAVPAAGRN